MKVNYPETIIRKSSGLNSSEEYVSELCNSTFLSFWSYPNVMKSDSKELCDLLVVFQNHVLIFSDKNYSFTKSNDIKVSWSRWYKKAVLGAAKQIYGAERWLFSNPNSIFLDSKCTQPFPFQIPKQEDAIVHRIVIAQGASDDCQEYCGGTGSLVLDSRIVGDAHLNHADCLPFAVGQVNPDKGYVHVFDDVTLGIVMQTLDTVSDFVTYLAKKERFFDEYKNVVVLLLPKRSNCFHPYYLQDI